MSEQGNKNQDSTSVPPGETNDPLAPFGERSHVGFVAIVGPANAGKSTLLNQLLSKKVSIVSPKRHTTRNRIRGIRNDSDSQIVLVDTPGFVPSKDLDHLARFLERELHRGVEEVDVVVLVLDARALSKKPSKLTSEIERIKSREGRAADFIVLNKVDVIAKPEILPLLAEAQKTLTAEQTIIPISAETGDGVPELLSLIKSRLVAGSCFFPSDMLSDQTESFFIAEMVREKVFKKLREELPYSTAVIVDELSTTKDGISADVRIVVERDSQKGIVIGKGGSMLMMIGSEARLELESLFNCKVHLATRVVVEEKWSDSERGLRRVGLLGEE